MKKRRKKSNFIFILIFILGFGIMLYPQVSRYYYRIESSKNIKSFDEGVSQLDQEEIDRRMDLAKAFNASLVEDDIEDPYSDEKKAEGRAEYARMLEVNEKIGHIKIPRISVNIPTYAGTSDEILQYGAGHLEGTSLPIGGNYSHSVITAHSGLPTAELFSQLKDVQMGDKFYFYNIDGVLAYQVDQIKIVEPEDFDDLLVVPGEDFMTLLTCTPIMINSHRLLVRGHRVDYDPLEEQQLVDMGTRELYLKYALYGLLAMSGVLLVVNIYFIRSKRRYDRIYKRRLKERSNNE